jgi:hemolysin activation/secretion protein
LPSTCHRHYLAHLGLAVLSTSLTTQTINAQTTESLPLDATFSIAQSKLQAQLPNIPPQDILPPRPEPTPLPSPEPLPPLQELLPTPAQPQTPDEIPSKTPQTITVETFKVIGSTVFTPAELAIVTEPFTDRPLSLAELFQARSAVTQLYLDRGYITSGAYIPPQKLQGGVVTIQVVEGSVEAINVTGTQRLSPQYIRRRIALATQKPLSRDRLLQGLRLLQLDPLIKTVSAELSAGTKPGENELVVTVAEAKTFEGTISLDNGRSPSVGSFRRRFQLREANLLGQADSITASYTNTNGSNSLDLNYTWPVNPRNGTVSFSFGASASEIIEPPFDALELQAKSHYYELAFRQPIVQTPNQEFALGLTFSHQNSKAEYLESVFGFSIPFESLGSDAEGRTRVSAVRLIQEWSHRGSQQVFALRSQFSVGLDFLDSTINTEAPDSRFFAWRGQGQWVRRLAPDTLLILRTDAQVADRALVALEQFGLGGFDSVRAYRQDSLLTDNGVLVSAEARIPLARFQQIDSILSVTPFIDLGKGWNQSGRPDPDPSTLAAVGLGLRWQTSNRLTARLEWGVPLVSNPDSDRTLQENGLYLSIVVNPF